MMMADDLAAGRPNEAMDPLEHVLNESGIINRERDAQDYEEQQSEKENENLHRNIVRDGRLGVGDMDSKRRKHGSYRCGEQLIEQSCERKQVHSILQENDGILESASEGAEAFVPGFE